MLSLKFLKKNVVRINISSTFLIKNKCVECNKYPNEYYWINLMPYDYDTKSLQWLLDWYKKYVKRMTGSWYLKRQPKHFHLLRDFNFYWTVKSYKPALHHKLNVEATDHIIEYLVCPCGRTVWAFNQKDGEERPEIKNRKGRYNYPRRFESFG